MESEGSSEDPSTHKHFRDLLSWLKKAVKKSFKYYTYPSRIFMVVVWCSVLWSFLGEQSLPALSLGGNECVEYYTNISSIEDGELTKSNVMSKFNDSYLMQFYYPVAVVLKENSSYEVFLLHKHVRCTVQNMKSISVSFGPEQSFLFNYSELQQLRTSTAEVVLNEPTNSLLYIPGGHFFALTVLLIVSSVFGVMVKLCCLPPLVGMIIAGFMLRNIPIVLIGQINPVWSSTIRNIALVIVLIRGGLSLSLKQLKRLKCTFVMLAFIPCVLEGILDGIVATFYLQLPWQWGFMLGFIIAAISPAIVVPTTLVLQEKGYGTHKGIPTLVIGAASFDVVISISFFGIFLGLAFSEGQLVLDIFRAPIQVVIGLLYGVLFGIILWIIPLRKKYCERQKAAYIVRSRFFLLFGLSLFAVFGSRRAILGGSSLAGSGPLAVVVLAFVAGQRWGSKDKMEVSRFFYLVWQFAQPLLFGLIGAELDIAFISPSLVGQAFVLLLSGLLARLLASNVVVVRNGFNWKEKLFIAIAWLPKATVQAAIGSIALDTALAQNLGDEDVERGRTVLTIAVIAIFLTAPLGGIGISLLGPILLSNKDSNSQVTGQNDTLESQNGPNVEEDVQKVEDSELDSELDAQNLSVSPPSHAIRESTV